MDNKKFTSKMFGEYRLYFIVIAVFAVMAIFTGNGTLAGVEILVLAALSIYHFITTRNKIKDFTDYIGNLDFCVSSSLKESMMSFPLPMTVMDLTGKIIWHNSVFEELVGNSAIEKHISEIVPELEVLKILENRNDINLQIKYNGRDYALIGNVIETSNDQSKGYTIVLYWMDKTDEVAFERKYNEYRVLNTIILIDNYEDIVKGLSQSEINRLVGKIDQTVSNWVAENNGIMRKIEKDRYYVIFENKDVINIIADRFEILNSVREIQQSTNISPTLSIGIGNAFTIQKSEEYAKTSLDMALGRGGDQAVIRDDEGFRFFGGKTEGNERNTRVKSRVVAHALRELIGNSSAVFVTGHKNCDADSFGSAVAICKIASIFDKKGYIVIGEQQSATKKLVEEMRTEELFKDAIISEADAMQMDLQNALMVVVDTHNPTIIDAPRLLDVIDNKVLIDHHRRGANYIEKPVLTYHEPYASSTCEMVTEVFQYISDDAKFTPKEAQAVYAGIMIDTKNFNMKTGVRTFEAASFLRRMGVDTLNVKKIFQSDMTDYVLKAKIVANAQRYKDVIAISTCEEDIEDTNILASQAADELLNISGIKASFVICKNDNEVVVSGRSFGDYNVQIVLEKIGGGGHMTIAGAQFKDTTVQAVLEKLKSAIDETEE